MKEIIEECYGQLVLVNILSAVWIGDWDRYEEIFKEMPDELQAEFPFHPFYHREQVELWYENHFLIPGDYFVSPYFSSYVTNEKDEERRRQDLLCLISIFNKTGFYYPLEKESYPDHLGCLTSFVSSALQEEIKALQEADLVYFEQLVELKERLRCKYIVPVLKPLIKQSNMKINHLFFKEFLQFYGQTMEVEWMSADAV